MIELGLAINTTTSIDVLAPYCHRIDFVQCMGIARIGFQGEPFDERVLDQVRVARSTRPDMPISVDGAVNMETAKRLVETGATRLVSGSAILEADDFTQAIAEMKNLVS